MKNKHFHDLDAAFDNRVKRPLDKITYPSVDSQTSGAAVRLLACLAGDLGSTTRSDYKRLPWLLKIHMGRDMHEPCCTQIFLDP